MVRPVAFRHHLEFLAFRFVSFVIVLLPERLALSLCGLLGWLGGVAFRIRRADVDRHLSMAFPGSEPAWRSRVARRSYRHLAREAAMALRLASMESDEAVRRTDIEGFEHFRRVVEEGRGAVLITGHLGNWEVGAAAFAARGVPMNAIAHLQKNPLFDRHLVETRNRLGLNVIVKNQAFRVAPRLLSAGRVVGFLADQNLQRRGVFVDFFGHLAATARGPALFALRKDAPVFVAFALRLPGWPSRYRVTLERVPLPQAGSNDEAVKELTQRHVSILERHVREAPDQYFWQHRRWKTRPDSEPP